VVNASGSGDERVLITADGHQKLRRELESLRTTGRREMRQRLREAREQGELADNPALLHAIEQQAQLERRIAELQAQLAAAQVVTPTDDGTVGIGSCVRIRAVDDGELAEYELVGAMESDVANGRVSSDAPLGQALLDRSAGDIVEVTTPAGTFRFEIISVRPAIGEQTAQTVG
jgi:transcription elongation factor GreA